MAGRSRHGYVEGGIVRLKLENFVTYDSVEFRPGPHLNVIIGPNGTGKSTIVCAICLGLAGKPALLGRAPQPVEFIKHGCQKSVIEIELYNPNGDNYSVRREINKNNSSQWSVNGRTATQKAVEETVSRLNIQIGNLCQFLPQDKVSDFAKMSPQELLENTEKAVGADDMYENHCKLKNARQRARDLELQFSNSREYLEKETQKNSRLEQDVRNYEERQRHLEKIKILQMKRPWVEYDEKRSQHFEAKQQKAKVAEEVKRARAQNAPLQKKLDNAKAYVGKVDQLMKQKTEQVKVHAHNAANKSKALEDQTDRMVEVQDEIKVKKAEETKRQKRVNDLQKQLTALQADFDSLGEEADVQPSIDEVNRETRRVNMEMAHAQQRQDVLKQESQFTKREISSVQGELQQLQNINNRRLEILRSKHKHTHDAVVWLRANKHLFKAPVHEPIMLVINMKDPAYAKYIENHISYNDMRAFVFEDADDMELFYKIVKDQQKLKVNAARVPSQPLSQFQPPHPISHYRKYGFFAYLKDLFDCPDAVMRYLCLLYRVHMIPVGNRQTKDMVETIVRENPDLRSFYTENHQYSIKKSRYGGATSSRSTELKRPRLLTVTVDMARVQEIQTQLKEKQATLVEKDAQMQEVKKSLQDMESKMNTLRNQKKELTQKRDSKKQLASSIQLKQGSIQRLEADRVNIENEEKKAMQKIKQINVKKCKLLEELKDHTQMCMQLSMDKVRLSLQHSSAMREALNLEKQLREQSVSLQNVEREFEELKNKVKQIKDTAVQLLQIAKKATNTQVDDELSPEMKRAFETCPGTIIEIDAAIHAEQARADCTFNTDESVVREYAQRKKDIAKLQQEVTSRNNQLENHKKEIEHLKTAWIEPLQELVGKINNNFGNFFRQMHCAGEVDLSVPENPEDYEKYGVRIKVKYRDAEQLRELTPFHQSGGERSVATVLYMMALQELTRCPFRCVDEINQGMDPINERKVFELVVKTACRENTSQYFLLTPKLLPDLEYTAAMTVLCVYNGPQMINHTEFDLRKFLKRRSRLTE